MDKFFNSLEYIDIDMACQWLGHLIESPFPLPSRYVMELCEHYSTPVYIDCSELEGVIAPRAGSRFVIQHVIGIELCQVESPAFAYEAFEPNKVGGINVTGMAVALSDQEGSELSHVYSWTLTNQEGRPFLCSKRPARPPFARTPRPASCAFSSRGFIWKRCTRGARPGLGTSRPGGAAG